MLTPSDDIDLSRDPEWFALDIRCAVADMAENFSREDLLRALSGALEPLGFEAVDLEAFKDAA